MRENRPWGYYETIFESDTCKVKKILVRPNQRLSYQRHKYRSEHWFILSGEPLVTLNDLWYFLLPGDSIDIPAGDLHRIESNDISVEFIEIQTGSSFEESDIERLEDDYGRN